MTGNITRYAVISTHNRHDELTALVKQLSEQCDGVVIIDNMSSPPVSTHDLHIAVSWNINIIVIRDTEQPPNLSRLWNVGLDAVKIIAEFHNKIAWDVAILNDDAVIPADWFADVSHHLRNSDAVIACRPTYQGAVQRETLLTEPDNVISQRMCGWAFMMKGEIGLRTDESLRWWYGDTDLDWQARQHGGMLIVPGEPVGNRYADQSTKGVLATQAGRDRERFLEKWGQVPW